MAQKKGQQKGSRLSRDDKVELAVKGVFNAAEPLWEKAVSGGLMEKVSISIPEKAQGVVNKMLGFVGENPALLSLFETTSEYAFLLLFPGLGPGWKTAAHEGLDLMTDALRQSLETEDGKRVSRLFADAESRFKSKMDTALTIELEVQKRLSDRYARFESLLSDTQRRELREFTRWLKMFDPEMYAIWNIVKNRIDSKERLIFLLDTTVEEGEYEALPQPPPAPAGVDEAEFQKKWRLARKRIDDLIDVINPDLDWGDIAKAFGRDVTKLVLRGEETPLTRGLKGRLTQSREKLQTTAKLREKAYQRRLKLYG